MGCNVPGAEALAVMSGALFEKIKSNLFNIFNDQKVFSIKMTSTLDFFRLVAYHIDDPKTWQSFVVCSKKTAQIARELTLVKQNQFVRTTIIIDELLKIEKHIRKLPNGNLHGLQKFKRHKRDEDVISYRNGKKHGRHIRHDSAGKLIEIVDYINDKEDSVAYRRAESIFENPFLPDVPRLCGQKNCSLKPSCNLRYRLIKEIEEYRRKKGIE